MREVEVVGGEPDLFADGIGWHVQARLICLSKDTGMCFDQVVIGMGEVVSELLGSRYIHCLVCKAHMGCVGVSELERRELCGGVLSVVNGELCQTEPIGPLSLFLHAKESQVLLNFSIHDLFLAICLRVMSCGEFWSDAESLAEVVHDL